MRGNHEAGLRTPGLVAEDPGPEKMQDQAADGESRRLVALGEASPKGVPREDPRRVASPPVKAPYRTTAKGGRGQRAGNRRGCGGANGRDRPLPAPRPEGVGLPARTPRL